MKGPRDFKAAVRSWVRDAQYQAEGAERTLRQGVWTVLENVQEAQRCARESRQEALRVERLAGQLCLEGAVEPRPLLAGIIRGARRAHRLARRAWEMERNQ